MRIERIDINRLGLTFYTLGSIFDHNNYDTDQMPKEGPSSLKDRFNRVQGQLGAVERMIDEGEDSDKTLNQLQAVISSLESIKRQLVIDSLREKIDSELDTAIRRLK